MRMTRVAVFALSVGMASILIGGVALAAGPTRAPDFGVVDPLDANPTTARPGGFTGSCPWPNGVDQFLPEVEKCLPAAIGWSEDGVRIVSDPLVATSTGGSATGAFTFWCQSRVGLRFMVTVQGLAPFTTYSVQAFDVATSSAVGTIATIQTDKDGNGGATGVVHLDPGGYDWAIRVGTVLETVAGDEIGFEVM